MEFTFTSLEKKAITKVLIDIAHADSKIAEGENQYFDQIMNFLKITQAELEEAQYLSVIGCLTILRGMTLENKQALMFMMREMINVDGKLDEEEMKIFMVVCQGADIPVPPQN